MEWHKRALQGITVKQTAIVFYVYAVRGVPHGSTNPVGLSSARWGSVSQVLVGLVPLVGL
jgi:hypothetical protein